MSFKKTSIIFAFFILFLYGGLIASVGYFLDMNSLMNSLSSDEVRFSIKLSLTTATIATLIAVIFAIPAGYALSRYKFRGKEIIDTLLEFPMVVSPAALGAIILIFFNNPLGVWIQENAISFVFGFYGIVLAQFITITGVAVRFIKNAFDDVSLELESTARTMGASQVYLFFTITLPLAKRGIVAGIILSWAKALGEFGATIMVAGTMAFRTQTLPISIYMHLESADITGTVSLILILVFIGLSALFFARRFLSR